VETFAGGGLVLPDTAREEPQVGNVLAVDQGVLVTKVDVFLYG